MPAASITRVFGGITYLSAKGENSDRSLRVMFDGWSRRIGALVFAAASLTSALAASIFSAQPHNADDDAAVLLQLARSIKADQQERWRIDRVGAAYHGGKTASERARALAELRDRRFPRRDANRLLAAALEDEDHDVRVSAGELMFAGGAGERARMSMRHEIEDARHAQTALRAAELLTRHRERIPPEFLFKLSGKVRDGEIARQGALQGMRETVPLLRKLAKDDLHAAVYLFGLLGAPEGADLARQMLATTRSRENRVIAQWALWRMTADPDALAPVLNEAESAIVERKEATFDSGAAHRAVRLLCGVPCPAAVPLFRRAVNSRAIANYALASLFYVQRDDAFVDDYVRRYLLESAHRANRSADDGLGPVWPVDANLVWDIVAARGSVELVQLAVTANPERSRQRLFNDRGYPTTDTWIASYLAEIPFR